MMTNRIFVVLFLLLAYSITSSGEEGASYRPSKVVYDVFSPDPKMLAHILDRASFLQNIYHNDPFEASIVLVVHEGAVPLFGASNKNPHAELMSRANSLAMGDIIQFRICQASARLQGFKKSDLQQFVSMVPMADAEIVMLQQNGYAYLR